MCSGEPPSYICCHGKDANEEAVLGQSSRITFLQEFVTHSLGRFAIVGVFLALVAASGWSSSKIDIGITNKDLFTSD